MSNNPFDDFINNMNMDFGNDDDDDDEVTLEQATEMAAKAAILLSVVSPQILPILQGDDRDTYRLAISVVAVLTEGKYAELAQSDIQFAGALMAAMVSMFVLGQIGIDSL
jgi:hypothetical protein